MRRFIVFRVLRSCNKFLGLACAVSLVGCLETPVPRAGQDGFDVMTGVDTEPGIDTDVATPDVPESDVVPSDVPEPDVQTEDTDGDATIIATDPAALVMRNATDSLTVENADFAITFERRLGWTPGSFRLNDGATERELLYTDDTSDELGLGLLLYEPVEPFPVIHATWEGGTSGVMDVLESGRAIVHVRRDWSIRGGTLYGSTDYVIHADGRVHLFHTATLTGPNVGGGWLVAYVALPLGALTHVKAGAEPAIALVGQSVDAFDDIFLAQNATDEMTSPMLCASSNTEPPVAAAFIPAGGQTDWPHGRITLSAAGANSVHSVRLQYDLARDGVPAGVWNIATLFAAQRSTGCDPELGILSARYRMPLQLAMAEGSFRVVDDPGDPDSDGYVQRFGYYAVAAGQQSRSVEFSVPLAMPRFTVRIDADSAALLIQVERDGVVLTPGTDFLAQPAESGRSGLFLVMLTPTPSGQSIRVSW
jgi:hypothetical protein